MDKPNNTCVVNNNMKSVCSQYRVGSKAALVQGGYGGIVIDQWLPADRLKLKDRAWFLGPINATPETHSEGQRSAHFKGDSYNILSLPQFCHSSLCSKSGPACEPRKLKQCHASYTPYIPRHSFRSGQMYCGPATSTFFGEVSSRPPPPYGLKNHQLHTSGATHTLEIEILQGAGFATGTQNTDRVLHSRVGAPCCFFCRL